MSAQYKTFEEAERALFENSKLKNKTITDKETNKTHSISSLVVFPNTSFDGNSEVKVGYDVAVFFKNEMSFVLLNEIGTQFLVLANEVTPSFA